jgi:hypothetical protein
MGAAESSNTSESVTKLANTIQQSTKADTTQVSNLSQNTDFTDCKINLSGDLSVKSAAELAVSNSQIAAAKQDANLQNNVAQTALQEAKSTVGALGVGFATANNAARQLVDVSNDIRNDLFVSAGQFSNTNQSFSCNRTYIQAKNLNIDFTSKADFLSKQSLKNEQTAKIVNDITQTIDQKATATVEGLSGLLFMIILIILAIGYTLTKPFDTAAGKILMITIITCIIIGVFIWMWATEKPPLFGKPDQCIASSKTGQGDYPCKNVSRGTITISNSPLRYAYPIFKLGQSNLVQMVIAKVSGVSDNSSVGVNNGGYNINVMKDIQNRIDSNYNKYVSDLNEIGIIPPEKIPNPLMNPNSDSDMYLIPPEYGTDSNSGGKCTPKIIQVNDNSNNVDINDCPTQINPSVLTSTTITPGNMSTGIANLNIIGWNEYLGSGSTTLSTEEINIRNNFSRFCLCDILDVELNIYVEATEYVKVINENGNIVIRTGEREPERASKFVPSTQVSSSNDKIESGGVVEGQVGTLANKAYNIKTASLWVGVPIIIIILIFFIYMVISRKKKPEGKQQ